MALACVSYVHSDRFRCYQTGNRRRSLTSVEFGTKFNMKALSFEPGWLEKGTVTWINATSHRVRGRLVISVSAWGPRVEAEGLTCSTVDLIGPFRESGAWPDAPLARHLWIISIGLEIKIPPIHPNSREDI